MISLYETENYPWLRKINRINRILLMISLYWNKISSIHLEGLKNKILKIVIYELLFFTIL